jgi:hypothetical protein
VIDNHGLVVVIHIPVVVALLDHDGVIVIPVVTIADDFTVAVAIAITITVAGTDRHADRTDAYANFFRTCRHRKGYSSYCYRSHYKMFHRMFLGL